jgi:quinolinate synthase
MAETASILSPAKTVILPRQDAGCPMADMITADALDAKVSELSGSGPSLPVVTYVNSSAAVKARSTICCTSANAVKVVESLDADEILMGPDKNLARYAASKTGKRIHLWEGYCPYHDLLTPEKVQKARRAHPDAIFMAHPECRLGVLQIADVVASTSGMLKYARESNHASFIVGTEIGLLYPLKKQNPDKTFFPASSAMECADMKKISLDDIVRSLDQMEGEVKVPEEIRKPALNAVQRMVGIK